MLTFVMARCWSSCWKSCQGKDWYVYLTRLSFIRNCLNRSLLDKIYYVDGKIPYTVKEVISLSCTLNKISNWWCWGFNCYKSKYNSYGVHYQILLSLHLYKMHFLKDCFLLFLIFMYTFLAKANQRKDAHPLLGECGQSFDFSSWAAGTPRKHGCSWHCWWQCPSYLRSYLDHNP